MSSRERRGGGVSERVAGGRQTQTYGVRTRAMLREQDFRQRVGRGYEIGREDYRAVQRLKRGAEMGPYRKSRAR